MSKTIITCPVSAQKVNENIARVVAFFTILVFITAVFFNLPLLLVALAADFYLRAFTTGKYSPLKYLARRSSDYLGLDEKPTDAAPKKFAAGIGMVFSIAIAALLFLHYSIAAYSLGTVLLICAGPESFKGFCLGCVIYTFLVLPFLSKANS
jgi:hypothetical protein